MRFRRSKILSIIAISITAVMLLVTPSMAKITEIENNSQSYTKLYQGADISQVLDDVTISYQQTGQPEYVGGDNRQLDELIMYVDGSEPYNTPYNTGGLLVYSYQGAFAQVFPDHTMVSTRVKIKALGDIEAITVDGYLAVTEQNILRVSLSSEGARTGNDYESVQQWNTADLGTTLEVFPRITYSYDEATFSYKPDGAYLDENVFVEYESYHFGVTIDMSQDGDFSNDVEFEIISIVQDMKTVNMLTNCFIKSVQVTYTKDNTISELDKWGSITFSPDQNIIDKWGGSLESGINVSIESDSLIEGLNTNRPDLSLDFNVDKTVLTGVNLSGLYDNPIVSVSLGLAVVFIVSGYLLYGKGG